MGTLLEERPHRSAERFEQQTRLRDAGDDEAQFLDEDFLTAPKSACPGGARHRHRPAAMLLTDSASIREVILFRSCARWSSPAPRMVLSRMAIP